MEHRPQDGRKWWELVYDELYPIAEKSEVAPVQPSQPEPSKTRKESKVTTAKPEPPKAEKRPEPKTTEKKAEPQQEPAQKEEAKAAESETIMPEPEIIPEKAEVAPVQQEETEVEGQMELEKDFPEYLPEDYVVTEDGTEVLPARPEKQHGPQYEIKRGELGYELYDDGMLLLVCVSANNALLIKAIMEKEADARNEDERHFTKTDCEQFFRESEE